MTPAGRFANGVTPGYDSSPIFALYHQTRELPMSRSMALFMAGLALSFVAASASAAHIYCTATGSTQGAFTGDATDVRNKGQIPVLAFMQEITASADSSTGAGAGKVQTQPFTITKAIDSTSVQFFLAAVTGENFKSIVCQLVRETNTGEVHPYFRITLNNARITDLKDSGDGVNGNAQGDDRERITFSFQKIELQDLDSATSVTSTAQ